MSLTKFILNESQCHHNHVYMGHGMSVCRLKTGLRLVQYSWSDIQCCTCCVYCYNIKRWKTTSSAFTTILSFLWCGRILFSQALCNIRCEITQLSPFQKYAKAGGFI